MDGLSLPFTRQVNQSFGSEPAQVPFYAFFAVDREGRFLDHRAYHRAGRRAGRAAAIEGSAAAASPPPLRSSRHIKPKHIQLAVAVAQLLHLTMEALLARVVLPPGADFVEVRALAGKSRHFPGRAVRDINPARITSVADELLVRGIPLHRLAMVVG